MKVFRGPAKKDLDDDSHVLVATIDPGALEEGVKSHAWLRFNIAKSKNDRQAVCTARFDEDDIVPMIRGLLARLTAQQELLADISKCLKSGKPEDQVPAIKAALRKKR